MSDIYVTLSGNVTDDPRQYQFRDGSRVTSMRMAVNRRVLDQQTNTWQTKETTYYTVRCYRGLADNVQQSIRKGHPVVVYGKLRIKQFERDGEQRFWAEVEASSVGHDLKWGIASFEKPIRAYAAGGPSDDERRAMEDATREWELTGDATPGAVPAVEENGDEAFDTLIGVRSARDAFPPAAGAWAARGASRHEEASRHDDKPQADGPEAPGMETTGEERSVTDGGREATDPEAADGEGAATDEDAAQGRSLREGADAAWLPPALAA
ncbi:hypothetical protein GCM10010116_00300 [Microbispora rosea subsp. aerata]|nr:single-stranded DNA-binding protein [Microbispora rosea]GGO00235.1 hypothetical protein GCM10010116_00300 [Microbispora rosea subsp. aerata]GIH56783.1 hypothetical protein Mro02_36970 [Microbispora rosea subsp. aerata]GLJ84267.1 hypothetical protein GCM10017588_29950 [Microbispora rosea subsp. aerata]